MAARGNNRNMTRKLSKRALLTILLVLIVSAYLALSPNSLSRAFLYQPQKVASYSGIPESFMGAQGRAVSFPSVDGKKLHGYFFKRPNAPYTFILHHGQGGNVATHFGLAKTVIMSGFSVLIYDYEGFGLSEGNPSNQALLNDGEAAYQYLTTVVRVKPDELIHLGVSLGTGIASDIASKQPCAAVVLISPYTSLNKIAIEHCALFGLYPPLFFPQPDLGSLEFIKSNTVTPVMIIHGKNDPIIAARHAEELYEHSRSPCFLVMEPKSHHGDLSTLFLATQFRNFARGVSANRKKAENRSSPASNNSSDSRQSRSSDTINVNSPREKSDPDSGKR